MKNTVLLCVPHSLGILISLSLPLFTISFPSPSFLLLLHLSLSVLLLSLSLSACQCCIDSAASLSDDVTGSVRLSITALSSQQSHFGFCITDNVKTSPLKSLLPDQAGLAGHPDTPFSPFPMDLPLLRGIEDTGGIL